VQPRYWGAILDSARRLGVEVVGLYVMWDLHEVQEGRYEFASLHAFLAEVEKRGLSVLARPGPFFYAEWRNLGIPDHAVPFGKHHPQFRSKAAAWIAAVMNELRPYLGRLIVAVQADNEIDPMPHFYGEDQGFADWLRRRYETIERLNEAWNTTYVTFDEPIPWLAAKLGDGGGAFDPLRRRSQIVLDSCQYRYDLATNYARWVVDEYRRNGCTVPILLNTWPGVDAQNWRDLAELADFFGIDPYPPSECPGGHYRYFRQRLRLLRCVTRQPYLAEFGAGVWQGAESHDFSPEHYRLTALSALAAGVRGWNWYMLVNRDNWVGAPINERGVVRPELGEVFSEMIVACKSLADCPPPEVSFGVTWSWHYHQLAQICGRDVDDSLFGVLHEMGLEYELVDVEEGSGFRVQGPGFRGQGPGVGSPPATGVRGQDLGSGDQEQGTDVQQSERETRARAWPRLLFVAGEIEDPGRLWEHVERGGILVCFQRLIDGCALPDGTSHPNPQNVEIVLPRLSVASAAAGAPRTNAGTSCHSQRDALSGGSFLADGPVFSYRRVPGLPVAATQRPWRVDADQQRLMELAVGRAYTTGYLEPRGAGTLLVLGCRPSRDAVLAVHRYFNVAIPALALTPGVHVSKRGRRTIVVNPGDAKSARVQIGDQVRYVDLPRCGGVIL
jgi:hypothetical protein